MKELMAVKSGVIRAEMGSWRQLDHIFGEIATPYFTFCSNDDSLSHTP